VVVEVLGNLVLLIMEIQAVAAAVVEALQVQAALELLEKDLLVELPKTVVIILAVVEAGHLLLGNLQQQPQVTVVTVAQERHHHCQVLL
jgi:hypothetical protein